MSTEETRLDWHLAQRFLGLLARIANSKAAARERLIETPAPGEEIVELGGRRWRVTIDAAGNRQATPLGEEAR